jgi:hypothetical protein
MCERPGKPSSDLAGIFSPVVQFDPPDIARCHIATWNRVQTDTVEVVRREPFEYGFRPSRHLLIMSESGERDDGETVVEGLPKSTLHALSRRLSFVPAGHFSAGRDRFMTDVTAAAKSGPQYWPVKKRNQLGRRRKAAN